MARIDIFVRGLGVLGEQSRGGHHLARLAIAALGHVDFLPGLLNGMRAIRRKPFERGDRGCWSPPKRR